MAIDYNLLESIIGKDPLYETMQERGLLDPENILPYTADLQTQGLSKNQLADLETHIRGYTSPTNFPPSGSKASYIAYLDEFGNKPSGPLYGKSIMDDAFLDSESFREIQLKPGGEKRYLTKRENITDALNNPDSDFRKEHALSGIFGHYTHPDEVAAYPDIYKEAGYSGGWQDSITERNKEIAQTIGHEARHQLLGDKDSYWNQKYANTLPSGEFDFYGQKRDFPGYYDKNESLNRMLDFQAYNDPNIYQSIYGEMKMPRNLTNMYTDALSENATAFTNEMLGKIPPGNVNMMVSDAYNDIAYPVPSQFAAKDIVPAVVRNLFNRNKDKSTLVEEEEGIPGTTKWQKFLSKITRQPYRGAARPAGGYTPTQLNQMNALGGYYSEPARQQRSERKRVANMLARQAAGKSYSQANLNRLTMGSRPGHYDPPGGGGAAADTSPSTPGNNPFGYDLGGLATMFERRR